jgi:nitroimidazol reductase NimA-like FMN-containing flavoprotein (pyridoxamine 5'-phosphate oxidase superfamily)
MIGILGKDEIETMLHRNRIGRLGCSANDRPYVVPINYGYDGKNIYGYSVPGRKISIMREQPLVSFLVDEIESPSAWRSVVVEGVYEELTDEHERRRAIHTITQNGSAIVARSLNADSPIVVFRLRTIDKSGRFERNDM